MAREPRGQIAEHVRLSSQIALLTGPRIAFLAEIDGLTYCNDGDWVESCTALVEDEAGELALLRWQPTAATIASEHDRYR